MNSNLADLTAEEIEVWRTSILPHLQRLPAVKFSRAIKIDTTSVYAWRRGHHLPKKPNFDRVQLFLRENPQYTETPDEHI